MWTASAVGLMIESRGLARRNMLFEFETGVGSFDITVGKCVGLHLSGAGGCVSCSCCCLDEESALVGTADGGRGGKLLWLTVVSLYS